MKKTLITSALIISTGIIFLLATSFGSSDRNQMKKDECANGFCMTHENAVSIEMSLQDMAYYLNMIESGNTDHDYIDAIRRQIKKANEALNEHLE